MKLEDDPKVIEFFLERESKPGTQKKYQTHLKHYIKHAGDGLTPTELIREAISEERAGVYIEDRQITKRFLRLKQWLLLQDWADISKRTVLSNIKTFYKTLHVNEIPSTTIKVKRERQIRITDLPSQVEIKNAVLRANPKYQAILLIMASSGLMQGDILRLKLIRNSDYSLSLFKPSIIYSVTKSFTLVSFLRAIILTCCLISLSILIDSWTISAILFPSCFIAILIALPLTISIFIYISFLLYILLSLYLCYYHSNIANYLYNLQLSSNWQGDFILSQRGTAFFCFVLLVSPSKKAGNKQRETR